MISDDAIGLAATADGPRVLWQPQPGPQTLLIECPIFEVFFGGARGGGKTDGMLGDWLSHSAAYGEGAVGVFFRRHFVNLSEVIARSHQIFGKLGWRWRGDTGTWTAPNGARLLFRHLDKDSDADNYQGHNYSRNYFEELTQFPSPRPINLLKATLRSAVGVPTGFRATGNPGGPGHGWVKKRYIDPDPKGFRVLLEKFVNPWDGSEVTLDRTFIPSKLVDNALLMRNDPAYVARLYSAGSKQLVQAWLMGEWDIIDGAFFAEFDSSRHIRSSLLQRDIPSHALVYRSMDWGFAKPFSVGWWTIADGTWGGFRKGCMVRFQEWYGYTGMPNEGVRLDSGSFAAQCLARDREIEARLGVRVSYGVADPAIFAQTSGPSIAEQMAGLGLYWQRADNKRIPGWQQVRSRLSGGLALPGLPPEEPMMVFLENCEDSIRTLPLLQHDEHNAEDLDTDGEDHAADDIRYGAMARPWVRAAPRGSAPTAPPEKWQITFNEAVAANRRRRLASRR